jgi:hypothetical protein
MHARKKLEVSALLPALLFADLWFSGVRSTVERKGPVFPPREKSCLIDFIDDVKPDQAHDVLGTIQVYVRRNGITMGRRAVYEEAVPEFRKQACKLGANAVLVSQQVVSRSGEFKLLYARGEAIRYLAEPEKK